MNEPIFTGSHGMTLAKQPSYLRSVSFICNRYDENDKFVSRHEFKFEPEYDYGLVSIEGDGAGPRRLPAERLRDILEGHMSQAEMKEYLKSF